MKSLTKVLAVCAIVVLIPASSFAWFDVGAYGGFNFGGKYEVGNEDTKINGWDYGFLAHISGDWLVLLNIGFGAYYQSNTWYVSTGYLSGDKYDKHSIGLDMMVSINIPILHPYVRGGLGIWEKAEDGVRDETDTDLFKSGYFGIGATFTVFPMIQIFGEYVYNIATPQKDAKVTGNSIHFGARFAI